MIHLFFETFLRFYKNWRSHLMPVANWCSRQHHHSHGEIDLKATLYATHFTGQLHYFLIVAFSEINCNCCLLWPDGWKAARSRREQFLCIWFGDVEEIHRHHHRLQGEQEEQGGADHLQNRSALRLLSHYCLLQGLICFVLFFATYHIVSMKH